MNELTYSAWAALGEKLFTSDFIVCLWAAVYVLERTAEFLNLKSSEKPLPKELAEIQPETEQKRANRYLRDRTTLGFIRETVMLAGFFLLLKNSGFTRIHEWALSLTENAIGQGLIFAGALSLIAGAAGLPFSVYSTFVIEARYGFNRTTPRIFATDLLKGMLVGGIIGAALFWFASTLFLNLGPNAWFFIWVGFTVFQLLLTWVAPVTILPLFLKLAPLKDGELKSRIEAYAKAQSFALDGAYSCDASKRSAKSNAFFTGFGRFRRLVLFDTLMEKHPPNEIVAIVAHEAGHFKLGHIWKGSILSAVSSLILLFLTQWLISTPELYFSFDVFPPTVPVGLVFAYLVIGKTMFFLSFLTSWLSRRNEYSADRFSVETARDPDGLVNALKRLTTDNLAILNPHSFYIALFASHPPLVQRMAAIRRTRSPE